MRLKKIYESSEALAALREERDSAAMGSPEREELEQREQALQAEIRDNPKVKCVQVLRMSNPWRPSEKLVTEAMRAGWISFDGNVLQMKTDRGVVGFQVNSVPDRAKGIHQFDLALAG